MTNRAEAFAELTTTPEFAEVRPCGQSLRDYSLATFHRAVTLNSADIVSVSLWLGRGKDEEFTDFLETMGWLGAYDASLLNVSISHQIASDAMLSHGSPQQVLGFSQEVRNMEKLYCFATSELHYGSDLKRIGTTATYCHEDRTLVLDTPEPGNSKVWIGNSLHSGDVVMAMCILYVDGRNEGHHWLRVPLRNDGGIAKGISVAGAEPKGGLDANQTGIISFDHAAVPASALMSRWASIDDGVYRSSIPRSRRFDECLATFTHERMFPMAGAVQAQRLACAITTRFAAIKKVVHQPLLEHDHYRMRLAAALGRALGGKHALEAIGAVAVERAAGHSPSLDPLLHALVACGKNGSTWDARHTLAETRELCGGLGFHNQNQIISLLHDYEIGVTFGGDNTVIGYQAARIALRERPSIEALLDAVVRAAESHGTAANGQLVRWMSQICHALLDLVHRHGSGDASVAWSRAVYQTLALGHWATHRENESDARLFQCYASACLLEHAVDAMRSEILDQNDVLEMADLNRETGRTLATEGELLALLAVPEELITAPIAFPDFAERHLASARPAVS